MDLCGTWQFRKEGSDNYDGLSEIPGIPALALFSHSKGEFVEISSSMDSLEEVCLKITSDHAPSMNVTRHLQLGKLSYHTFEGMSAPTVACIVHCGDMMDEFSFLWLGPGQNQRVLAHLRLDQTGQGFRVDISIDMPGTVSNIKLVKYFTYVSSHSRSVRGARASKLLLAKYSRNWLKTNSEPSELAQTKVDLMGTVDVRLDATGKQFMDSAAAAERGVLILQPLRRIHDDYKEGDVATYFILKVTYGDYEWKVLHRFREFESVYNFVVGQIGNEVRRQLPPMPPKTLFKMSGDALMERGKVLLSIVRCVINERAFGVPNVSDAMYSFLEIPEHNTSEFLSPTAAAYAYEMSEDGLGGRGGSTLPQDALHAKLSSGFEVLKHSRSRFHGKPTKRVLRVDNGVKTLFWSEGDDSSTGDEKSKSLCIADIISVTKGTESKSQSNVRRKSVSSNLGLCISISTPERTLDPQH